MPDPEDAELSLDMRDTSSESKAESLSGLSMLVVVVPVEAVEILLAWWQEKSLMNFQLKIEIARLELQLLHPNAAFKTRFKTIYWLGRRPVLV